MRKANVSNDKLQFTLYEYQLFYNISLTLFHLTCHYLNTLILVDINKNSLGTSVNVSY